MASALLFGSAPCTYCKGGLIEYSNGSFIRYDDTNSGIRKPSLGAVYSPGVDNLFATSSDGTMFELHNGEWSEHFLGNSPISSTHVRRVMNGRDGTVLWLVREYDGWYNSFRIWGYNKECEWFDVYRAPNIVDASQAVDGSIHVRLNNRIIKVVDGHPADSLMIASPQPMSPGVLYTEVAVDDQEGLWYDAYGYVTYDQMNNATVHEGLAHHVNGVTTIYHDQNSPLQGQFITEIEIDELNNVWVLTSAGVFRYRNDVWTSWLNWTTALANRVATGLVVRSSNDVWVKYYNGVAHIRNDAVLNFDLTGQGDFTGAGALEDSLMFLFNNYPDYVSTYNYQQSTVIADSSGYWLSPANSYSLVAQDGSVWFGNQKGIYHFLPEGFGVANTEPTWSSEWQIYPNPVTSNSLFVIGVDPNVPAQISLCAMDGRLVHSISDPTNGVEYLSFNVRAEALNKGVYIISLQQGDRVVSARFVLE